MGCVVCVPHKNIGVVEQFGAFKKLAKPGCSVLNCPFGESMNGIVSLRVQQLDVRCETKTQDNVFVHVVVAVQYQVIEDKVYEAFYKLTNPQQQITAYVFDVVRASVPKIPLDDVFEQKDEIALVVKDELRKSMHDFGFQILQCLITDIEPDRRVKDSMNDINAAQRKRIAANDKAEAEKVLVVKAAEADAESKYLAGLGIARQRKAIVEGLRDSVLEFSEGVQGATPKDVMDLVLVTQYFDTLKDIGSHHSSNTVFISGGSHGSGLSEQVRDGFLQGDAAKPKPQ